VVEEPETKGDGRCRGESSACHLKRLPVSVYSFVRSGFCFFLLQARRLGLLVPGMPGYAAERERLILAFRGVSSTTEKPEVWDALGAQRVPGQEMEGGYWRTERYEPTGGNCLWDEKLVSA